MVAPNPTFFFFFFNPQTVSSPSDVMWNNNTTKNLEAGRDFLGSSPSSWVLLCSLCAKDRAECCTVVSAVWLQQVSSHIRFPLNVLQWDRATDAEIEVRSAENPEQPKVLSISKAWGRLGQNLASLNSPTTWNSDFLISASAAHSTAFPFLRLLAEEHGNKQPP